ncbi:hypothetical protein P3L10_008243 [Capsicum annuum]
MYIPNCLNSLLGFCVASTSFNLLKFKGSDKDHIHKVITTILQGQNSKKGQPGALKLPLCTVFGEGPHHKGVSYAALPCISA